MKRTIVKTPKITRILTIATILFITIYIGILGFKALYKSIAFNNKDRVTIVFYGPESTVLSLGLRDETNYIIKLSNDYSINVPGGYGWYKIGGIGRLAELEKDNTLLVRAFSSTISTPVDYYFIPKDPSVYFNSMQNADFSPSKKYVLSILGDISHKSNVTLLDRILIYISVFFKGKIDFIELNSDFYEKKGNDIYFRETDFYKKHQGFFYKKMFREAGIEIKMKYNRSYKASLTLSRILEGTGLRVVDISQNIKSPSSCIITYKDTKSIQKVLPQIQNSIAPLVQCKFQKGNIEGATMEINLNITQELLWK